jgi:hypothetical protein
VVVNGSALLTIATGATDVRPQFSSSLLTVANDGSAARLNAAGVRFDVPVAFKAAAAGTVGGNVFNGAVGFDGDRGSTLSVTGNSFNGGVDAQGEFVPRLPANAFAPNSTVGVSGTIDAPTTWPVIPNVGAYSLSGNVVVNGAASLTIANGVTVVRPQFSSSSLIVANDNTTARLDAAGVRFDVPLSLKAAAVGTLSGNVFGDSAAVAVEGDSTSLLVVAGNTFNGGADVQAEFVPRLPANAFAPGSVIGVSGIVDAPTAWPPIPNVDRYSLSANVTVVGGATLTLGFYARVGRAQSSSSAIVVANDSSAASLRATGSRLDAPVSFRNNAGGRLRYCDVNSTLTISGSSTALVQENDLRAGSVVAEGASAQVIDLRNNYWGPAATADDIEARVLHRPDSPANTRPLVLYEPYLDYDPTDLTPPVLGASFTSAAGGQQVLRLVASEDVSAALALADLVLRNLTTDALVPIDAAHFSYAAETNVVTVVFDPPLPDGRYRLTVAAGAVTDPAGNPMAADLVYDFTVSTRPVVTEVFVSGAAWSAPFKTFLQSRGLGSGAAGFLVFPGPQPVEFPWTNLDRVSVRFDRAVAVAPEDLSVLSAASAGYTANGFTYDPATFTAAWTLATPLKLDRVRLSLTGVTDAAGANPLADFSLPFDVVPGDADRNGRVDAFDTLGVKARQGSNTTTNLANYSPWFDVDGNGRVDAFDTLGVKARQGANLNQVPVPPNLFGTLTIGAASGGLVARLERDGRALA